MENTIFFYFLTIFGFIIGILAHDDRVLNPSFQISLNHFRKNCNRKGLLPEIINIQEEYASLLTEISQDLLLAIHYKETETNIINSAVENLCNRNENLKNLLYTAADNMLRCLDNSENVDKNSMTKIMLDQICTEQRFRYHYNRNFYHDADRGCIWDAAKNISECYKEQCARRIWRIAENCECVGADCAQCNEICYDPFFNNILLFAPINFSQKECDDLYRRVTCQLDPIRHCGNTNLKKSYESIYTLDRVHHCLSKVPDWH